MIMLLLFNYIQFEGKYISYNSTSNDVNSMYDKH